MSDELRDADELDNFIEQRRRDDSISPSSTESAFAADLMEVVDVIQPSTSFLANMEANLQNASSPLLNSNGQIQEGNNMQIQTPIRAPFRQSQYIPWTLAATLALVFLTATILVGLSIWPSISQSSLAASTTTPVPAADKVLPIAVGGYVSDFNETDLQMLRDAGITWIGIELPYQSTTPSEELGLVAESLITAVHKEGFKIFVRVVGNPDDMAAHPETYNNDFGRFVNAVAYLGADAIQIWNAQNLDVAWPKDHIDPAAYIELLRVSYAEIKSQKEINPDVIVITGAPAPTSAQSAFQGRVMNDDLYYQGMAEAYAAVGTPIADCIGVNYIEGMVPPDQTSGDSRDNYPTRYFTTMLRRAYTPFQSTGLPLCITDLGYLSLSAYGNVDDPTKSLLAPLPAGFEWAFNTTVEQQAEWLASAIKIASEMNSIQIRMVMIWRINGLPGNTLIHNYSIIHHDGCPACTTIATLKQ